MKAEMNRYILHKSKNNDAPKKKCGDSHLTKE